MSGLRPSDVEALERLTTNELDMAFRRRVFRLLELLELDDGLEVLDCGCGEGFYLLALQRLRPLGLTGLDADAGRLQRAEEAHGIRARLVAGDAQRLPFEDESFDRVLTSEVLEHLPDDAAALREIHRVLKPGGVLAISVPNARYPFWWDPINATWTALGGRPIRSGPIAGIWSNHVLLYRPEELAARVREAGFELEVVEESTHYCVPFIHFVVYGIGKPLIEHGLVPKQLLASTDRLACERNAGARLNPFNVVRGFFRLVDRLNERPSRRRPKSYVNVLVKARKSAAAAASASESGG